MDSNQNAFFNFGFSHYKSINSWGSKGIASALNLFAIEARTTINTRIVEELNLTLITRKWKFKIVEK